MAETISGRCLCGAVRFRFREAPLARRACWCRDCQYLSSGNASINAIFPTASLEVEGPVGEYFSIANSGNRMRRRFCKTCGTPLFSESSSTTDKMAVRVGALDNREIGGPDGYIWTGSAPSWGYVDRATFTCDGQS